MRTSPSPARAAWLAALLALPLAALPAPDLPAVRPNDNLAPAGRVEGGVHVVRLEARRGTWLPDGPRGPRLEVAAFGEQGGPLQTPGPLVRVRVGTTVRAVVRNALDVPMSLHGLGTPDGGRADSVRIPAGETREIRFRAAEAGTFHYTATTGMQGPFPRMTDDSQLHGAIVVDPADAPARPRDRVFVISSWFTLDSTTVSGLGPDATLTINGRSWPNTERLVATQGDTVRWRFVNTSILEHPMHLHGFYFTVDARGDGARDTVYAPAQRRQVVTEVLMPNATMAMTWTPVTSGNWIMHCHFASHISTAERLEHDRRMPVRSASAHAHRAPAPAASGIVRPASLASPPGGAPAPALGPDDMMRSHMAGLVLGITVRPRGPRPDYGPVRRDLRLEVRSKAAVYGEYVGYSYVLGGSPEARDPAAMPIPGPTLVLDRGERVAVNIVNRTHEPAAVHWHGIELESWADGVAGWSGAGRSTLPLIEPGDSLVVRFTPPRAGTFMYHSHSNEFQQISSGLYGAIIVQDPAAPRDTARERLLVFSDDGPLLNFLQPGPHILLNGKRAPAPIELRAGVTYRLRLVNIRSENLMDVSLLDGDRPAEWRVVAVDGAELPEAQRAASPAHLMFASGQIRDIEFTPRAPGRLTLHTALHNLPPPLVREQKVEVVVR